MKSILILMLLSSNAFATLRVVAPSSSSLSEFDLRDGEIFTSDDFKTLYINSSSESVPVGNPPGVILAFGGTVAPTGYLLCDGEPYSRTEYANLFAAIGTAFGPGNGTTTFNVPDLRGRFLRGVDGTAGNDPDKTSRAAMKVGGNAGNAVGSIQSDENKAHSHTFNMYYFDNGSRTAPRASQTTNGPYGTTTDSSGGAESRPKNAYVNYIIKI